MTSITLTPETARAYLIRKLEPNLPLIGALDYEVVSSIHGVERDGALVAVMVHIAQEWSHPERLPLIMLAADDADALIRLFEHKPMLQRAIWSVQQRELLALLEEHFDRAHAPERGVLYYEATTSGAAPHPLVHQITLDQADALNLKPCALSLTALRNWIRRGWRVFGAIRDGALLSHALAAYPIEDTEEVSAVYTAVSARNQGLASAVVSATIADITRRGRRAVYATKKTNHASRRVATRLGLTPLLETWEVVDEC